MDKSTTYPLEQITTIKQKKLDEAERVLREKKALLEQEREKLLKVEKERDVVKEHKVAKLTQVREQMDEGAPSAKIQQMRYYLKVVDEKLKNHEMKVNEQKKAVTNAEGQVEIARDDLIRKQQDVEKMHIHRKEWEKERKLLEEQKENLEADEMGSVLHQRLAINRKKKKNTS